MPLDPITEAFLKELVEANVPALDAGSVEEARANAVGMAAIQGEAEPVARVENREIPGPGGDIPVRIYRPEGDGPFPALVYLHGGGWVICDLDTHDATCRALANALPAVVVSVDYRLAPEHRFPAGADDAYAATRWVADNATTIGADPQRLIIGGDSAGGNLSAVVTLMARDRGGPALAYQILIYPVTDASMTKASYTENADGYLLTRRAMEWFWGHYLGSDGDGTMPYTSPLLAPDLRGLPPATVITAEFDPLRDEGDAYAERLREAGVPVQHACYAGQIHGFFSMGGVFPQARTALDAVVKDVQAALGL
jgi:acetyl esterase